MTRLFTAAAVLLLLSGCSVDRGSPATRNQAAISTNADEVAPETFALGTEVSREGAIPREAAGAAFRRGGEIFLSVDVTGASTDQMIDVTWVDARGRVAIRQSRHVPEGAHYAVFSSGPTRGWMRGSHRALVVINGRLVSERQFALM